MINIVLIVVIATVQSLWLLVVLLLLDEPLKALILDAFPVCQAMPYASMLITCPGRQQEPETHLCFGFGI